jgi:predicted P-loop ATPase
MARPLKNIPQETLLMMKIDIFLNSNYELRKNVMRGVAEYRMRTGLGFSFQDLTTEARNSITINALSQGIKCWDKDIMRYVNSNDITLYDPMDDFLEHLPRWDGKDRVEALARRIKTDYEAWPHLFHIWMRSMVAMWKGKGQLTGNALVPLLIGRQGCGKSSFCRILLPREQREYYNDRINFKNEHDLNLGLTSFALVNLDEFDKITQRQQILLKYLVSTSDLKYRPPYGTAYSSHRRYASFIGTTNELMPLVDPTGSRRFICVMVDGDIDFETPVEYGQLYAQLKYEVEELRERYFLTKEEEAALMHHNLRYQKMNGLGEMLLSLFEKPDGSSKTNPDHGKWLSVKEISDRLKQSFKGAYQPDEGTLVRIGQFLSRPEYHFESERKTRGWVYWVKEKSLA